MNKKQVVIEEIADSWIVRDINRKKGQRRCQAQFDKRYSTIDDVKKWIEKNMKLELMK